MRHRLAICAAAAALAAAAASGSASTGAVLAFSHCCGTVPRGVEITGAGEVRQVSVGGRPVFRSDAIKSRIPVMQLDALLRLARTSGFFALPRRIRNCKPPVTAADSDSVTITVSSKTVTKGPAACASPGFDRLYAALVKAVSSR